MLPNSSSYVQINIYDQNLRSLKNRGINLERILLNLGCEKHWIIEVPIYSQQNANNIPYAFPFYTNPNPNPDMNRSMSFHNPPPVMQAFRSISSESNNTEMFQNRQEMLKETRKRISPPTGTTNEVKIETNDTETFKRPLSDQAVDISDTNKRPRIEVDNAVEGTSGSGTGIVENLDVAQEHLDNQIRLLVNGFQESTNKSGSGVVEGEINNDKGTIDESAGNRIPKNEPVDPDEEEVSNDTADNNESFDFFNESTAVDLLDMMIKQGLFTDGNGTTENANEKQFDGSSKPGNEAHVIKCQFPDCTHTYSWKVRYGKLRLVDHALTHVDQKLLPCRICGFLVQNVRKMRTHYSKEHPADRPLGYGMKAMPIDVQEMKELWKTCYGNVIGLIGEATISGGVAEKVKRKTRKNEEGVASEEKPQQEITA